ncbi:MAG: T9SS type A sorting domain-containing protein [Ignavibacteriaceae bacterium]|nr:T9SS type A sorting domain-containing protein [Ignavibacteriaceae bacterium]
MNSYFNHPEIALPKQNGYNVAIWNIFVRDKIGYFIIKRQWELIPNTPAILAIDQSCNEVSTSLKEELNNFGIWTYFTNSRAVPGIYFEEAANYPLLTLALTTQFISPSIAINQFIQPTANKFIKINLPTASDFLIAAITNGDAFAANENPNQLFPFAYQLFDYNEFGSIPIVNNYYYALGVSNQDKWRVQHIFNNIAGVDEGINTESYYLSQNYSNPFNPSTRLQYAIGSRQFVTLKVYDLLGKEIATLVNEEKQAGVYEVEFNAANLPDGKTGLPSGIYFYQLRVGQFVETKKMILLK